MISVVLPTHNPNQRRLDQTLAGLAAQSMPTDRWELIVVDNGSRSPIAVNVEGLPMTVVREERLGLTHARLCGIERAKGDVVVFVDDDNVLAPDYLGHVEAISLRLPQVGAFGGKSLPQWEDEQAVPSWIGEFVHNLALRDLGEDELTSAPDPHEYPAFSPIGAGLALRKQAIVTWVNAVNNGTTISDRKGNSLTSGGDNDLVLHCLKAGYSVGYFPRLQLRHIIPPGRLTRDYHARLSYAMTRSWVAVLESHAISPWKAIEPWTSGLRKAKAFVKTGAWQSPAAWIRWHAACGLIDGQVDISRVHRGS